MRDEEVRRRFDLLRPQRPTFRRAIREGLVVTLVMLLLSGIVFGGAPHTGWLVGVIPPMVGLFWAAKIVHSAWHILTPDQRDRLGKQLSLVHRRAALEAPRETAKAEMAADYRRIGELTALATKMKSLDPTAYSSRIAVLDRVCLLLKKNSFLNLKLIDGYDRVAAMLEIEIDSLDVVISLPEESTLELDAKLSELEALREQLRGHERALAADAEVADLLAGPVTT